MYLRREPARCEEHQRSRSSAASSRWCRCCSSRSSRTSAPRSRCCRSFWGSLSRRTAHAAARNRILAAVLASPFAWKFALKDYQTWPDRDVPRSRAGSPGSWIPDHSGTRDGRLGRAHRQGLSQGHTGAVQVPAGRPQRFHLLCPAEEHGFIGVLVALGLYLFVIIRSLEAARLAKDRLGAYLVGASSQVFVSGDLQRRHVGRACACEGHHPAAHELWGLVSHRDDGNFRSHPECQDATLYQLTISGFITC